MMKVYLLRHGDYQTLGPENLDTLTTAGREKIAQLAQFLQMHQIKVSTIYHSGINRALETAEILAQKMNVKTEIYVGLRPMDEVSDIASDLLHWDEDTLIVSHLPFLSRLVTQLVYPGIQTDLVSFDTGTCVALEKLDHSRFIITWMLNSTLLECRVD